MKNSLYLLLLLPVIINCQNDDIRIIPARDESADNSLIVGVVSLWPKDSTSLNIDDSDDMSFGRGRGRRDRCPKFGEWKNVTCWWPDMDYSQLPEECTYMPLPKRVPEVIQQVCLLLIFCVNIHTCLQVDVDLLNILLT